MHFNKAVSLCHLFSRCLFFLRQLRTCVEGRGRKCGQRTGAPHPMLRKEELLPTFIFLFLGGADLSPCRVNC